MATDWSQTLVTQLRILIGDWDSSPTYDNSRLQQILTVAAVYVKQEMAQTVDYTIDVDNMCITPDPTDQTDDSFANFMVLKAACIIDRGNMRIAAMTNGLKARCGPAQLDTLNRMSGFTELLNNGYCAVYEKSRLEYELGNTAYLKGVLSPFNNLSFDSLDHASSTYPYDARIDGRYYY